MAENLSGLYHRGPLIYKAEDMGDHISVETYDIGQTDPEQIRKKYNLARAAFIKHKDAKLVVVDEDVMRGFILGLFDLY
jgi:hypothetical protein